MTETPPPAPLSLPWAHDMLRAEAGRIAADPMTNSVFALAQRLLRALETGEATISNLAALARDVDLELIDDRAARFREQHAGGDTRAAWAPVRAALEAFAAEGFDAYAAATGQTTGGIVFTAHPTFALSRGVRDAFARHAARPGPASREALKKLLKGDSRAWNAGIRLEAEHAEVQAALAHAAAAQRVYAGHVIAVARAAFPDRWRELRPALPTLASWVGYDLDGRTDIHWSRSLTFRLQEKSVQLGRYAEAISALPTSLGLGALTGRLERASVLTAEHAHAFSGDLAEAPALVAAANALTAPHADRLVDANEIVCALTDAMMDAADALAAKLMALRAEVEALQLGTGRIHLRVNAAQVRTVLARDLGLETEDRELGRLALAELAEKARKSKPVKVNFADLYFEQSTARRQFMMCAQMLKHIDSGSVIRFLIAESENPATVMGALYLARQYGVADKLDISPLFETPEALETGGRFIERLLDEPEFLAYVRQRGYLSVQLGFSDAGRFIGQVAADMAIERIHNLIARALAARGEKVSLLIFNTHGESMGRGAWPGRFDQRLDHVLSPWTRSGARARGLKLMHEVSFQGGDGFLHFATPVLAETTLAAWCAHALSVPEDTTEDPFYTRTDLVWDFYRSLRGWHERLFGNPDYGRLLGNFAAGLVVKAGSRPKKRTGGPSGPSALRAISHNATLQQLGIPANTAAGIGSSLQRENDRLVQLIDGSPRMRGLILLASRARELTSLPALRGYASVFDPSVWVALARMAPPERAAGYRAAYYVLRTDEMAASIHRIANILSIDLRRFDRLTAQLADAPSIEARHEGRLHLHVLHAVRQALMMEALSLAGRVPRISERHDASTRDIIRLVADMRISEAVSLLGTIFPLGRTDEAPLKALTESGSGAGQGYGYDRIHRQIITPLDEIDRTLHAISLAIMHPYGAFG